MKFKKWCRFVLASIFSLFNICALASNKNINKFDWLTGASAPQNYPMKIISGTFYYHDENGGLYIPDASSINAGWGTSNSSHVVGEDFKALPDRLDIRFFHMLKIKCTKVVLIYPMKKF